MDAAQRAAYIKMAKAQHEDEGVIEFDDHPQVLWSRDGDEGAYVSAWVWVSDLDTEPREDRPNGGVAGPGDHVHDHLLDR